MPIKCDDREIAPARSRMMTQHGEFHRQMKDIFKYDARRCLVTMGVALINGGARFRVRREAVGGHASP